jgi:trehalose utilization protein
MPSSKEKIMNKPVHSLNPAAIHVQQKAPLFSMGQIAATPAVLAHLEQHGVNAHTYLDRHVRGDWGDVPSTDAVENDLSVQRSFRVLSAYTIAGRTVWIITEADRSVTTLLFPSEY